jgi:rhodanese-related sulfurtransferase
MTDRSRIILVGASLLAAFALWLSQRPNISAADARALVAGGARLVDVRTPEEYAGGHLPGAVNIPIDELPRRLDDVGRRDQAVVVYCASGGRSASATRALAGAGFTSVHNLGAMSNWK